MTCGHISKAHAQHRDRHAASVENRTTLRKCVSRLPTGHETLANKEQLRLFKLRETQAAVMKNTSIRQLKTSLRFLLLTSESTMLIVDTGASMDVLDESAFQTINRNKEIALTPTTKRLFAYGSTDQLATIGQFDGTISFQDKRHETPIHVLWLPPQLQNSYGSWNSQLTCSGRHHTSRQVVHEVSKELAN